MPGCGEPSHVERVLIAGIVLTAAGLALHAAVGSSDFVIQTAAFLVGVNLFVAGLTTGGR